MNDNVNGIVCILMIMLIVNKDSFTSSFSIWMPFISFSCLVAVGRTSNKILNISDESGQSCLSVFHH